MLFRTKNPHGGDIYDGQVELDFSANTNPFGTPEGVKRAILEAVSDLHRYPDPYCRKLISAISAFEQVPEESILCGNGAAELIYAYTSALAPKRAAELAPTFSEYALGLERIGCTPSRYVLKKENGFQLTEDFLSWLEAEKPEALFLCNPNNPTGRLIDPELMEKILAFTREKGIHFFVDECFLDLSHGGISLKPYLKDNPQLFILKAFTKSYGMAGVRLGYCLCANPETLSAMAKTTQPWNVSSLAQAAGAAALKEEEFLRKTRDLIGEQRVILKKNLESLGFWVSDSSTNYLLFRGPQGLDAALREKHIAIRSCSNYVGLDDTYYRVAVRLPEENQKLTEAIKACLSKEEGPWQR